MDARQAGDPAALVGAGVERLGARELYPSTEALDAVLTGMEGGMPESFAQLDELLVALGA